jgi:hypothetical protein
MNLGKLLGAGKTFFGGSGLVAYRQNKRVYLPKFNSEKNPFTPKPAEPAPAAKPVAKEVSASVAAKAHTRSPLAVAKSARGEWTTKLNPFRAPEPVAPPPVTVQPEFSLDTVKVVHNDLADADIEIVPVKSQVVASVETPVLAPARKSWNFLGESLMRPS